MALAALCGAPWLGAQPAPKPPAGAGNDSMPTVTPNKERTGRVILPDRPTAIDANITGGSRPSLAERQPLAPEVALRIERFKRDARAYLQRQEALRKQLQGASDEERARLREQLENLRRQWLEQSRQMAEEFRDRRLELMQRLQDRNEVLENARDAAREQLRDSRGQIRKRRGDE